MRQAVAEHVTGKQALKASLIRRVGWWQNRRSRFVANPDGAALSAMRPFDTVVTIEEDGAGRHFDTGKPFVAAERDLVGLRRVPGTANGIWRPSSPSINRVGISTEPLAPRASPPAPTTTAQSRTK